MHSALLSGRKCSASRTMLPLSPPQLNPVIPHHPEFLFSKNSRNVNTAWKTHVLFWTRIIIDMVINIFILDTDTISRMPIRINSVP